MFRNINQISCKIQKKYLNLHAEKKIFPIEALISLSNRIEL